MHSTKEVIEQFVDNSIIAERDYELLDIIWIFSYSMPSMTGYCNNKEAFKKWLGTTCKRNLQKKHNLSEPQYREKMNKFMHFLNSIPDFLSRETYSEDIDSIATILMNKTSNILVANIEERLREVTAGLDAQILSLVLSYIPQKTQESLREAERIRALNESYTDKYSGLSDFRIILNGETGEISYYRIGTKEWTYLFNQIFNQELKEYKFKIKSPSYRAGRYFLLPFEQYEEYSWWQFGDELVKLGAGYWAFYISAKGNVSMEFIIPKFIFDVMQSYEDKFHQIEDISDKVSQIADKSVEDKWTLDDLADAELVNEVLEIEIEYALASNPGILEDGLAVLGHQYPTAVGYIDILCRDKEDNLVVVELKKGSGYYEVVGQIQKYMAWIDEHLAEEHQVRGIIVVKTRDEQMEYAIKGSKFPIDIKIFEEEPPIAENVRYCDKCGKANRKSAIYCTKCGNKFWL